MCRVVKGIIWRGLRVERGVSKECWRFFRLRRVWAGLGEGTVVGFYFVFRWFESDRERVVRF